MKMRALIGVTGLIFMSVICTSCIASSSGIDETMSLDEAKARAQTVEREIAETLPPDMLSGTDQRTEGTFLSCSNGEGEHWAGGLTAVVNGDPLPEQVMGPITDHFSERDDVAIRRRQDHGDAMVDIIGSHGSMWIVRYSQDRAELDVDSFSPCIRLPEGVWRGGSY